MFHVRGEGAPGLVSLPQTALEQPFPGVLHLVYQERPLCLEHLLTEPTLEARLLVIHHAPV